jgi:predicted nuclease of predicted toxin-antitoxin system
VKKKVLIDECLTFRLTMWLEGCTAETVAQRGWAGKDDGEILRLAEQEGFDVLLTADANMKDQQRLQEKNLCVVAIPTNRERVVQMILPQVQQSIDLARRGEFVVLSFSSPDFAQWPNDTQRMETRSEKAIYHKYVAPAVKK